VEPKAKAKQTRLHAMNRFVSDSARVRFGVSMEYPQQTQTSRHFSVQKRLAVDFKERKEVFIS
jgi:hypothetical protein